VYRVLNDEEIQKFIEIYFPCWKIDIWKVSCIIYKNTVEFLINEHYLFIIEKGES